MDKAHLRKAFALIAAGLVEKERLLSEQPTRYPLSRTLQHGINMFLSAGYFEGKMGQDVFAYADEAAFLAHYITKPIAAWFDGWDTDACEQLSLQDQPFYGYEAFAYAVGANVYVPSEECYDFLQTQDRDVIAGTDERVLYEKMMSLEQDDYCQIRRFIIEHPIIDLGERREILLKFADKQNARDVLQFAYEEFTDNGWRCPSCGWTMTAGKYGLHCHSPHCLDKAPALTDEMRVNGLSETFFRLKKGVMRYIAQPGKLELAIEELCNKKHLSCSLWPQKDRYDVEIHFPDGDVWEIDAKAYRNPVALRSKIIQDGGFPEGDYARGFYVIPTEFRAGQINYLSVVNKCLTAQKNVRCVTLHMLQGQIRRKAGTPHG